MSPHPNAIADDSTDRTTADTVGRRRFLALGASTGAVLLAGCSGDGGSIGGNGDGNDGTDSGGTATKSADGRTTDTGTFRLLISDRPNAIGDFETLEVTFDRARVFRSGDGSDGEGTATPAATPTATPTATVTATATETPENGTATTANLQANETATDTATATDTQTATPAEEDDESSEETDDDGSGEDEETDEQDDGGGFSVIPLEGVTVDLTELVGAKATTVFEDGLPAGRYTKIELYVAEVNGVVDGEQANVKIPSGKLMLTKPFEVEAGSTVSFVFDISVVRKGNGGYNLLPVISESGVAGKDVDVEEVSGEGNTEDDGSGDGRKKNGDPGGGKPPGGDGTATPTTASES